MNPEDTEFDTAFTQALVDEVVEPAPVDEEVPAAEPAVEKEAPVEPAAEGEEIPVEPAAEGEKTPVEPKADEKAPVEPAPEPAPLAAKAAPEPVPVVEAKKVEPTPTPAPEVEPEPVAPLTEETFFSAEEREFLASYDSEWEDVSKAEGLKRKFEIAQTKDEVYREVAVALQQAFAGMQPVLEGFNKTAQESHFATIRAAHEDFTEVTPAVVAWVEAQPDYLKPALKNVLEAGTATQVIDLYSRFKAQGQLTPQARILPAAPPKQPTNKGKVDALLPVTGGRKQAAPASADPNDFDSAWVTAANSN